MSYKKIGGGRRYHAVWCALSDYWLGAATLAFGLLCVYLVIKSGA